MTKFSLRYKSLISRLLKSRKNKIDAPFATQIVLKKKSCDNEIIVSNENKCKDLKKLEILVRGSGNKVVIGGNLTIEESCQITINGNNNTVILEDNIGVWLRADLRISTECQNGSIQIGSGTSIWDAEILNLDSGSSISIGSDCMISKGVAIQNSDQHVLLSDGRVCNRAQKLCIGNHVWIGMNVSILKNAMIPDGAVIGRGAIVAGRFEEPNCVIVGVPARIVKRNIRWTRGRVNDYEG